MKVAVISELGGIPTMVDRLDAKALKDCFELRVEAVALNPVDVAIASGKFYAGHPPLPYIPGLEAVGRIGDRLVYAQGGGLGISRDGFLTESVFVSEDVLIDIPQTSDPAIAAALGTAGLAGWLSVTWRADVRSDDIVVVLGATGAVGKIAMQAAQLRGAKRVVAVGRNMTRLETLTEDQSCLVAIGDQLAERITAAAGGQPTVVIDMTWGAPLVALLPVLAPGARVVQVGASAGAESQFPSAPLRGKQLNILGYSNFGVPRDVLVSAYRELVSLANNGLISLPISRFKLSDINEAWRAAMSGSTKVVVQIGSTT